MNGFPIKVDISRVDIRKRRQHNSHPERQKRCSKGDKYSALRRNLIKSVQSDTRLPVLVIYPPRHHCLADKENQIQYSRQKSRCHPEPEIRQISGSLGKRILRRIGTVHINPDSDRLRVGIVIAEQHLPYRLRANRCVCHICHIRQTVIYEFLRGDVLLVIHHLQNALSVGAVLRQIAVILRFPTHRLLNQKPDVGIFHVIKVLVFQVFVIVVGKAFSCLLYVLAQIIVLFPVGHILLQVFALRRLIAVDENSIFVYLRLVRIGCLCPRILQQRALFCP